MPAKPKNVDQYLKNGCGRCELGGTPQCKVHRWTKELSLIRKILLLSELHEEIKWSGPCYTQAGKNILLLSALKDSVVISFFRGSQMQDPEGILERPGANSRFARYLRIQHADAIDALQPVILSYISEATEIERSGKNAVSTSDTEIDMPPELIEYFAHNPEFEKLFRALTPGRQRGYLIHYASAKQSKTRRSRIEKSIAKIRCGKGWNER